MDIKFYLTGTHVNTSWFTKSGERLETKSERGIGSEYLIRGARGIVPTCHWFGTWLSNKDLYVSSMSTDSKTRPWMDWHKEFSETWTTFKRRVNLKTSRFNTVCIAEDGVVERSNLGSDEVVVVEWPGSFGNVCWSWDPILVGRNFWMSETSSSTISSFVLPDLQYLNEKHKC